MPLRCSPTDLEAVRASFEIFRESGCRIFLPSPPADDILLTRLSGHWFVAPVDGSLLGLDFSSEYRKSTESPLPIIRKHPYSHCPATSVHVGGEDYIFYFTPEERNSRESFMRGRELYALPSRWILDMGAALESK